MSVKDYDNVPAWLTDADEGSHPVGDDAPLWSENWLTYVWSPENKVGVYFHISRHPGTLGIYEETFNVLLPGDRILSSRGFRSIEPGDPKVAGTTYDCVDPFRKVTSRFRGGARLVTGDQLRAAPLQDGFVSDVDLELNLEMISPPFDYGEAKLDNSWGVGHYEQHHRTTGYVAFEGERYELSGTGLRDHSWGPREWSGVGDTTWYHGQFPSGRNFMIVSVPGRAPREPFIYAVIGDGEKMTRVEVPNVPNVMSVYQTGDKKGADLQYEFEIVGPDGTSRIQAEIQQSLPMSFVLPAQIAIGTHRGVTPECSHDNIETYTKFTWDGEVGYGQVTACRDLSGPHGTGLEPWSGPHRVF